MDLQKNLMPRSAYSILFLIVFSSKLFAVQSPLSNTIDSLERVYQQSEDDTTKIRILRKLAYEIGFYDNQAALQKAREASDLSGKAGIPKYQALANRTLGMLYYEAGKFDSAMIHYLAALEYFENNPEPVTLFKSYRQIAILHSKCNRFEKAERYTVKAMEMARKVNDPKTLGNAFNDYGGFVMSKAQFKKHVQEVTENKYKQYLMEADSLFKRSIEYFRDADYERGIALSRGNLAKINADLGHLSEALDYIQKAIFFFEAMGYDFFCATSYNHRAEIYLKMGRIEAALASAQKAVKTSKSLKSKLDVRDSYELLSRIYEKDGDVASALEYHKKYHATNEEILDSEIQDRISAMENRFHLNQQKQKIELQNAKLNNQYVILTSLGIGLLFLIVLVGILYRSNRRRKKDNAVLDAQKARLEHQNEEITAQRDILEDKNRVIEIQNRKITSQNEELKRLYEEQKYLMAMVAHDLKSPLNKIRGLSDILALSGDLNDEQKDIKDKIDYVSESGRQLIRELTDINWFEDKGLKADYKSVEMIALTKEIMDDYRVSALQKDIKLIFTSPADRLEVDMDVEFFVRIIDNLISNALKFSNPGTQVSVPLWAESDDLRVEVADEGPGISPEEQHMLFRKFQKLTPKPTGEESSTGLGLSIVKTLILKLEGDIHVRSEVGKGTTFSITFPLRKPHLA